MSVDGLNFSSRIRTCLKILNIKTIGELIRLEIHELRKYNNIGVNSYNEVVEKLGAIGLSFTEWKPEL